jgi:amidase
MMSSRPAICVAVIISLAACSKHETAPYAVEEVPLTQVSADLAAGKTTAVAVTTAYIARIKTYDGVLNSVIAIAPDALDQAAASDKRRKDGKARGPMDGVPILLKDNIDAVGMATTAGSFALADNKPVQDSEVAKRLRAAGAVILGKANLSQWAGFRTASSFNGSTVGRGPHNPYDLTRNPGGSSSGSGVAAAVSFAAATVGSDTSGSITSPSSYNGVVGLRPTVALISRHGVVPISSTQDTTGPMARSVTDAALLLTVLAGSDPGDPWSVESDAHKADYAKALSPDALKGKRLGVLQGLKGHSEKTQPLFEAALEVMKAQGADLVDIPAGALEDMSQEQLMTLTYDFKVDIAAYLKTAPAAVKTRTLAELIAFDKADARESMHGNELFEAAEATTAGRDNPDYIKNLENIKRLTGPEGIDRLLAQYNVSALVAPTQPVALPITPDGGADPRPGGGSPVSTHAKGAAIPSLTVYSSASGYPMLSVPMGVVDGLPVGLSFVGTMWSEPRLLAYGYAYEQASHARVPPTAYKASK